MQGPMTFIFILSFTVSAIDCVADSDIVSNIIDDSIALSVPCLIYI